MKNSRQTGFTMIELIVVIVILGVLAATALPKFIDMRGDAEQSAADGLAGAATSAMNLNYTGCSMTNQIATASKCVTVSTCAGVSTLMQGGLGVYSAIAASGAAAMTAVNGATASCSVTKTSGSTVYTSAFTAIAAGN